MRATGPSLAQASERHGTATVRRLFKKCHALQPAAMLVGGAFEVCRGRGCRAGTAPFRSPEPRPGAADFVASSAAPPPQPLGKPALHPCRRCADEYHGFEYAALPVTHACLSPRCPTYFTGNTP
jgi:hypothetical protein